MKRAAGLAAAACVFVFWAARSAFACDCAFVFEAGHHYVVFARRDTKGRPTTSTCTRTAETDRAQDVLKVLGRSKPPHRLP